MRMSENGKGSNTAKRTNFKKYKENFDQIDWGNGRKVPPVLPVDIQERIDDIKQSIEDYDTVLRERNEKDDAGE